MGTGQATDWVEPPPLSLASVLPAPRGAEEPLWRHAGPRAELAAARAALREARSLGDPSREAGAAADFARLLVSHGTEYQLAIGLAERALELREDTSLREELAVWYRAIGDSPQAAATLRPLLAHGSRERRARLLVRIAALLGQAADAVGAVNALVAAQGEDPTDPVPPELLGCAGGWAPGVVDPAAAAQAFLVASRRRAARGERATAFEDLLRAFEAAPDDEPAAAELHHALEARARYVAADEIRREHVRARGNPGVTFHQQTVDQAAQAGNWPRALGAAFDAGWDRELDLESALRAVGLSEPRAGCPGFDELAERVGLYQLLAARLEILADTVDRAHSGRAHLALGRLWAGPLGDLGTAVDAWLEALIAEARPGEALAELAAYASTALDPSPLVEALVRLGGNLARPPSSETLACLRELGRMVAEGPGDPAPIVWLSDLLSARGTPDPQLAELAERLRPMADLELESLERVRGTLAGKLGPERIPALRQLATFLRGRPDEFDEYVSVLAELTRLLPQEACWHLDLARVWRRAGLEVARQTELGRAAESALVPAERVRARLELARLHYASGDTPTAFALLRPLLEEPAALTAAWSRALAYAARSGDRRWRADALLALSASLALPVRAELGCVAADQLLELGEGAAAREAVERALNADPSAGRASATLARVAAELGAPDAASLVERALGVVAPRGRLCRALADSYAAQGESVLALTWTQRWLSLGPGCLPAIRALLERVTGAGDAERTEQAIVWVLSQPLPMEQCADRVAVALGQLGKIDPERARGVARRVLDAVGPRHAAVRQAILGVAEAVRDTGLAAAVLERSLPAETATSLLEHARRLGDLDEGVLAYRALGRAVGLGADAATALELLAALPPSDAPESVVAALEARALALRALGTTSPESLRAAWRECGAALWDLADDQAGARAAWREAAALDPERGAERLVLDLLAFAGPAAALAELELFAQSGEHERELPDLFSLGAHLALQAGLTSEALDLAQRALELEPALADALAVAEKAAGPRETAALARIYQRVADGALGCFGERAAHYRAARQLERRGSSGLAFEHAQRAFEAVPSAGISFLLLARLAHETGRVGELVSAVERVARAEPDPTARAAWLELAARETGNGEEGARQRCRALCAALGASPSVTSVTGLGEAFADLVRLCPEEREVTALRVQRAVGAILPGLAGPHGARTAAAAASLLLDAAGAAELAVAALEQGARCDPSIEEYAPLVARAAELVQAPQAARRLLAVMLELGRDPRGNLGRSLCDLGCALGELLGDRRASAELGLLALEEQPDDLGLVRRVEQAVLGVDDPELRALWFEMVPPARRAEALLELATRRKEQGDNAGSVEAFRRALATPGLSEDERQAGLERLEMVFGLGSRAEALERLLELAIDPRERIPWLRELGRLLEETDSPAAVHRYAELLSLEPGDEQAMVALERDAERRADYRSLADLLGRRAAQASDLEERRRLVLRRALVLDQRLAQRPRARQELETLLAETGDHLSALRVLADLSDRTDQPAHSADLWLRASRLASDPAEAEQLGRRACEAWVAAGEPERARLGARSLRARLGSLEALKLLVDVERRIGKSAELGQALEEYAHALPETDEKRAVLLVEAARVGEAAGDSLQALARAREAAALDPRAPGPQLIAHLLAYRHHGVGDAVEAERTIQALTGMEGSLSPAQVELRAFLLAQALALTDAPGRARAVLEEALRECGPRPLVAAVLGEQLAREGAIDSALPWFERALAGDLRGLRSRGKLALLGAETAERAGELERALGWLAVAAQDPDCQERAHAREQAVRAAREARARPAEPPPPSSSPIGAMRRAPEVVEVKVGSPPQRPTLPAFPATDEQEARLLGALANGSVPAGLELVSQLEHRPNRAHDLLGVCRQLVSLAPGELEVLRCLLAAARADHNPVYASAVEHAERVLSGGAAPLPPPLGEQREQPERVKNLVERETDAAGEALGLVWENAPQVFRRDPQAYGVTGLERIQLGAPTPLGRVYAAAARLLGMSRTPLFQRRDAAEVTLSVALLSPPAVLLAGDVRRESAELGYHLGAMLAAATPERVLLFGSSEEQAREVLGALLVGFGPPEVAHRPHAGSTHLAEVLWQAVPARAQRRLRELGDDPGAFQYEPAMANAQRAVRRAGLLACGDLGVAVRETLTDLGLSWDGLVEGHAPGRLMSLPEVVDLVRLATSPEYAEARWQPGRGRS